MLGRSSNSAGVTAALLATIVLAAPTYADCQYEYGDTCHIRGTEGDDTLISSTVGPDVATSAAPEPGMRA